jgi:Protein of unknown function (DUF4232)
MARERFGDMRNVAGALALGALVLGAASCGGQPASTGSPRPSASPSVSVSVSVSPSTSPVGGSGEPRCDVGQLQVSQGPSNAATGHAMRVYVFTNSSGGQCFLYGFPGLQMLDASGAQIPTRVVRGGGFSFPDTNPTRVELASGGTGSFSADWATATGYPQGCPTASRLQVTPPDSFHQLVIDSTVQACPDGTIHVSPVVAGPDGVHR